MKTIIEVSLRGEGRKEQARYFNRAIQTLKNTVTTVFKQLDCKDNIDLYRLLFAINVTSSDAVFGNFQTTKQDFVRKLQTITPRQAELLNLIPIVHGRGALIDSLSVVVGTSYHTVHKQLSDMLRRLAVNRVEDAYLLYLASLQGEEHD
jgi:DNA-binding CsgD family transcriptional regulator